MSNRLAARGKEEIGGSNAYDMGNVLSRVLSVGSNADRVLVPRRKLAPAALPCACAAWRSCRTAEHTAPHTAREMPFFNFGTVMAFLAWFGGAGYLLTRYSSFVVAGVLTLAVVAGLVGATIVFWFVAKVLLKHDRELDPADYERVGVLGAYQQSDSRRRNRRNHLFARRYAEHLRRTQRKRRSPAAWQRGDRHAVRERHRVRAAVGRMAETEAVSS